MPLEPTKKLSVQNGNLGIQMTQCILETTGVESHECVPKRARREAKGKAEEGGLLEEGDGTTGEHRIPGRPLWRSWREGCSGKGTIGFGQKSSKCKTSLDVV